MSEDRRTEHPFHMYEAIQAQPEAFVSVAERNEAAVDEFASGVTDCERLFLIGIGTSFHAARVGEHLVRLYGGGLDVRVSDHIALRVFQIDYNPVFVRSRAVNGIDINGQRLDNIRFSVGIVFK